jgi:hypothetical protein
LAAVDAPVGNALLDTTTAPVLTAVILPSMLAREVFVVSCFAPVAAPVGSAQDVTSTSPISTPEFAASFPIAAVPAGSEGIRTTNPYSVVGVAFNTSASAAAVAGDAMLILSL